jgi:FkbM family methyltransferase
MLGRVLQKIAVAAYALAARAGFMSLPVVRRLFIKAYRQYKRHIEAGPVDQLRRFVPEGAAVIDVGANVGFFTEKFAEWVGPTGTVIAVEPDAENLAALREAAARFGAGPRIELIAAVAADRPGQLLLERNPLHPGDHRIAVNAPGVDVCAVTIDALVAERRLRVAFIKIDVQGAELMVLQGARQTLRRDAPALFVEIDERALRRYGASTVGLVAFLRSEGYAVRHLEDDGSMKDCDGAALASALAHSGYVDVLCVRAP